MSAIVAIDEQEEPQEGRGSVSAASRLGSVERIFVEAFVGNGGNAKEAAIAAGFDPDKAAVQACRLLCRKRIADYIVECCSTFAHSALPVAIQTLIECASDAKALWKDRIKAANSLIEMAGLKPSAPGTQVNVAVQMNGQQAQSIIASVHAARSARMSDIPPAMSDTMEADFIDIERALPAPEPDPPGGDQLQGPAAGTCPLPASPTEYAPENAVSPLDTFRAAFNEDDE